ncbi:10189_t:CDS:10, partial [Entrophospora sp. SA101]
VISGIEIAIADLKGFYSDIDGKIETKVPDKDLDIVKFSRGYNANVMMFSPPIQRGIKALDKELFKRTIEVIGVRVPINSISKFTKTLKEDLFNQPKLRNVIDDPNSNSTKIVLLNPKVKTLELDNISEETKEFIKKEGNGIISHSVELNYDYWNDILKAILPEGVEVPSSFTQVGHIAHMNLRDEFIPWKYIISQVVLDKNSKIATVVNKTDMIDSTFRHFKMEILAGEHNLMAEVKESNCKFRFDFSKVYWNSRLHTEHDRDVFAGVGPFSIPAAKKGCIVYANDLNPESYKYLQENILLNKVKDKVHPYNLDGREFIKNASENLRPSSDSSNFRIFDHFVMNLPASAIEFLDVFKGLYTGQEKEIRNSKINLPTIHCHCFSKSENPKQEIIQRINKILEMPLEKSNDGGIDKYNIHFVRKVAPNKDITTKSNDNNDNSKDDNVKAKKTKLE